MYIGARRDLLATLQERAERAEREQGMRVEQAQVTERARIAREMHDVLAHRLSLVAMNAGALEYCRGLSEAEVAEAAAIIRLNAHRALADLRQILGVLRAVRDRRTTRAAPADAHRPSVAGPGGPGGRHERAVAQPDRQTWREHLTRSGAARTG